MNRFLFSLLCACLLLTAVSCKPTPEPLPVSKTCEESKVAIRNIRRDALDKLKAKKKASEITEDDMKDGEKNVQKLTDKAIEEVDKVGAAKEKEIMSL